MADKTMKFDITAKDNASRVFGQVGVALDRLTAKLDELGRKEVKPKVTADTERAKTRVEELRAALGELKNQRLRVDVDMGTGRTEVGNLRRELSYLHNVKVKVDLTVPPATQVTRVQQLREALRELDGINANATVGLVGTIPDAGELRRAASALKQLQDIHDITIRISITGDVDALARISQLRRELRGIPNSTNTKVNVDVDRSVSGRIAQLGKTLVALGAAGNLAAAGVGTTVPAVATLAGSLVSLVGLAPLAVGGLASLLAVTATVKVGLAGVGDALKNVDDPKKFAEALKELSPPARQFATEIRDLQPRLDGLKKSVQSKLFAGLADEVKPLANTYLPLLRSGMGSVATQLNGLGKDFVGFAQSAQTTRDVSTIFEATRDAVAEARPGVINLAGAFRDVAVVGTSMLPELASGWTNATANFRTFIAEARESGQLEQWIQGGIDTLQTLGSVAGNVGSSLYSVFTASKASGADFLTTLDRLTEGVAEFLRSAEGQDTLIAFFRQSRETIDALVPGVSALGTGVAGALREFSNTGGMLTFGQTVSEIAEDVAPLLPMLGSLAGDVLGNLASAGGNAAAALSPIVTVTTSVVGALGPLPALVIASVVAFKALGSAAIAGTIATLAGRLTMLAPAIGTYTAGLTGSLAAGNAAQSATSKFATALGKAGNALPLVGVALIAVSALWDEFGSKADENASKVINGSQSMSQAIAANQAQLEHGTLFWFSAQQKQDAYAQSAKEVTDAVREQYNALSPMQKLQADVAMAQSALNDAVVQFGANSPQATAAASALNSSTEKLTGAQKEAADAAKTHTQRLQEQADQMNSQINSALAYAEAVKRTADAQKAADDALKNSGKNSDEYKASLDELVQSMSSQADAARRQAEALGGTEAGVQAYNTELLRSANLSTTAGRDAFAKMAGYLDDAGLAALSSTAKLSGLRTEIITLPDGRKVTVVVAADQGKLDSVKQGVEELASKKYIGTVEIVASVDGAQGAIIQTLRLADGTTATMKINADGSPALLTVGQTKYTVDSTTGTLKVLGDVAPGEASLAGFKVHVDSETGVMTLDANPAPADAKRTQQVTLANGALGTMTLDANPNPATGKITGTVSYGNGQTARITIDGNQTPANGKINATVTYGNGRTSIIQVDAATASANGSISALVTRWNGYTININTVVSSRVGGLAGGGVIGYAGGGVVGPRPVRAARGLVLPGYQPGRDTVPAMLSKGEAVLVPEAVRALGARRILAMNAEVSGGRPGTVTGSVSGMMDGRIGRSRVASPAAQQSRNLTARIGGVAAASSRTATSSTIRAQLDDARLAQKLDRVRETIGAAAREGSPDVVAAIDTLARAVLAASRTSVAVSAQARRTDSELAGLR